MATAAKIAETVTAIFTAWNRAMQPGVIDAYALALRDVTDEQLARGAAKALRLADAHPPAAGVLRQICTVGTQDELEAVAAKAFDQAERAARLNGADWRPGPLGPLTNYAIGELGGWGHFCRKPVSEWDRRTFTAAFVRAASSPAITQAAVSHYAEPAGALTEERKQLSAQLRIGKHE